MVMQRTDKITGGGITHASGVFANCGPGVNAYSLQYNCQGPACSALSTFQNVQCNADGGRMSCSNDMTCPPGTIASFVSNFTFAQNEADPWDPAACNERDSLVQQEQQVVVASCFGFTLWSNGTREGTRVDGGRMTDEEECPRILGSPSSSSSPTATAFPTKNAMSIALPIMSPSTRPKPELVAISHGSRRQTPRIPALLLLLLISLFALIPPAYASPPSRKNPDELRQRVGLRVRTVGDKVSAFARDFSADLAEKANAPGQDGHLFAQDLVSDVISSVCDAYFSGDDPDSFTPALLKNCVKRVYGGDSLPQETAAAAAPGRFFAVFGASLLCDYVVSEAYPVAREFFPDACEDLQDLVRKKKKKAGKLANTMPINNDALAMPSSIPSWNSGPRPLNKSPKTPGSATSGTGAKSLLSGSPSPHDLVPTLLLGRSSTAASPSKSVPAVDTAAPLSEFSPSKPSAAVISGAAKTLDRPLHDLHEKTEGKAVSDTALSGLGPTATGLDSLLYASPTQHASDMASGSPIALHSLPLVPGKSLSEHELSAPVVIPLNTIRSRPQAPDPDILATPSLSDSTQLSYTHSASATPAASFDILPSLLPALASKKPPLEDTPTRLATATSSPIGIDLSPAVISTKTQLVEKKPALLSPVSEDSPRDPATAFDRPSASKPSSEVETVTPLESGHAATKIASSKSRIRMPSASRPSSMSAMPSETSSETDDAPLNMATPTPNWPARPTTRVLQELMSSGPSLSDRRTEVSPELDFLPSTPIAGSSAPAVQESQAVLLSSGTRMGRDDVETQADQSTAKSRLAATLTPTKFVETPPVLPVGNGTSTSSKVSPSARSSTLRARSTKASSSTRGKATSLAFSSLSTVRFSPSLLTPSTLASSTLASSTNPLLSPSSPPHNKNTSFSTPTPLPPPLSTTYPTFSRYSTPQSPFLPSSSPKSPKIISTSTSISISIPSSTPAPTAPPLLSSSLLPPTHTPAANPSRSAPLFCPSALPATCADACVNTGTNNSHCGACWRTCALGAQCVRGTCVTRSTRATATATTMTTASTTTTTTVGGAGPGAFANFIWKGIGGVVGGD